MLILQDKIQNVNAKAAKESKDVVPKTVGSKDAIRTLSHKTHQASIMSSNQFVTEHAAVSESSVIAPQPVAAAINDPVEPDETSALLLSVEQLLTRAYNDIRTQLLEIRRVTLDTAAQKDAAVQQLRERVGFLEGLQQAYQQRSYLPNQRYEAPNIPHPFQYPPFHDSVSSSENASLEHQVPVMQPNLSAIEFQHPIPPTRDHHTSFESRQPLFHASRAKYPPVAVRETPPHEIAPESPVIPSPERVSPSPAKVDCPSSPKSFPSPLRSNTPPPKTISPPPERDTPQRNATPPNTDLRLSPKESCLQDEFPSQENVSTLLSAQIDLIAGTMNIVDDQAPATFPQDPSNPVDDRTNTEGAMVNDIKDDSEDEERMKLAKAARVARMNAGREAKAKQRAERGAKRVANFKQKGKLVDVDCGSPTSTHEVEEDSSNPLLQQVPLPSTSFNAINSRNWVQLQRCSE